jgi:hypothetical protein
VRRHFCQTTHHRAEQTHRLHQYLRHRTNADRVTDLARDEVQQGAGGIGRGSGQMPHLADRAFVGAKGREASGDVWHVAVGVSQIGITDEIDAPSGECLDEHLVIDAIASMTPSDEREPIVVGQHHARSPDEPLCLDDV